MMNDQELIERFTPVCERQLVDLASTLELLASKRSVTLGVRRISIVDAELPESFRGPCVVSLGEVAVGIAESQATMVFHLTDVLITVGLMCMMSEEEILAKLEGGYTDADADAFGEACRQAFSGMGRVLSDAFSGPGEVSASHTSTTPEDFGAAPERVEQLFAEPRAVMVELDLQIEGYDSSEALVYWPLSLVGQVASGGDSSPRAGGARAVRNHDIHRVLRLKIPLLVLLAQKQMTMGEIMGISIGSVIEFEKASEEFLDFMIGDRKIGSGEAGKMGEKFCLQIKRIGSPSETLKELL